MNATLADEIHFRRLVTDYGGVLDRRPNVIGDDHDGAFHGRIHADGDRHFSPSAEGTATSPDPSVTQIVVSTLSRHAESRP